MRIAVVSECHVGSAWAHAINVIKTAGGFVRLGHEVTLLCRPHPEGVDPAVALDDYGETRVRVRTSPATIALGDSAGFARWAVGGALTLRADLVYCRHFEGAERAATEGLSAVLETHAYRDDRNPALLAALRATSRAARPLAAVVTIHETLREYYISIGGAADRIRVVPDGVDVEMFSPPERLPPAPWADDEPARPRAVYTGRLFAYKGVDTLIHAAALLPDWIVELVGGPEEEQARLAAMARSLGVENVRLRGQRALAEVPRWLWGATALVLGPSAREPSCGWTSPVKLGEYLAAGAPIVASDVPGLREWVDEPAVRWVAPDDAEAIARAVETCASETAEQRAVRRSAAEELFRLYSYRRRAERIIEAAIGSSCSSPRVDIDSWRRCAGNPR